MLDRKFSSSLGALAFLVFASGSARADEPRQHTEDESIGTRPALQAAPAAEVSLPQTLLKSANGGADEPVMPRDATPLQVAGDPPGDWAVLHAGFRPHLGRFIGIGTFALAHERSERFYGLTSVALVRNDTGTHGGVLQFAIGRNLADTFVGGAQISVTENRARNFYGLGQFTLAYNRAGEMRSLGQVAVYNRARDFSGLAQVGGYNRADQDFSGLMQVGVVNQAGGTFAGAFQIGLANLSGDHWEPGGGSNQNHFRGIGRIGLYDVSRGTFAGAFDLGLFTGAGGEVDGIVQVGAIGAYAGKFRGLAQIGAVVMSQKSAVLQIGAVAYADEEHDGIQLGPVFTYAGTIKGAQVGTVNVADKVRGVQIGVFNQTKSLRGLQIGLANHADDGLLAWSALLNMGFGDDGSVGNGATAGISLPEPERAARLQVPE